MIEYFLLTDYLKYLVEISGVLYDKFREKLVIYLCAAVSDFEVNQEDLPEHKISSSGEVEDEGLTLHLTKVPKANQKLRNLAPKAKLIGFKLETDETILAKKAGNSLIKNDLNCVIGNVLDTRRLFVEMFLKEQTSGERVILRKSDQMDDLEIKIAKFLNENVVT